MQAYNQASDLDALLQALKYLIPLYVSVGTGKQ
jgi:hypothetical protein